MAYTSPRTWAAAEIVTAALLNTHLRDNLEFLGGTDGLSGAASGLIASTTLASPAATVAFTGIPATYKHLRLLIYARSNKAGESFGNLLLQFNDDSTATNYNYQWLAAWGSSVFGAEAIGTVAGISLGIIPAATATAGSFAVLEVTIPRYAGTVGRKSLTSHWHQGVDTSGQAGVGIHGGSWESTNAITKITLFASDGGSLDTGTVISVLGEV